MPVKPRHFQVITGHPRHPVDPGETLKSGLKALPHRFIALTDPHLGTPQPQANTEDPSTPRQPTRCGRYRARTTDRRSTTRARHNLLVPATTSETRKQVNPAISGTKRSYDKHRQLPQNTGISPHSPLTSPTREMRQPRQARGPAPLSDVTYPAKNARLLPVEVYLPRGVACEPQLGEAGS